MLVTLAPHATANNNAVADVHKGIGDDTIKLLRADNSATFDTMQSLIFRLSTILGLGDAVAYDPATQALTINLGALLPDSPSTKTSQSTSTFGPRDHSSPLVSMQTDTVVNVSASVGFDDGFTLGVYLGDTVPGALSNLCRSTPSSPCSTTAKAWRSRTTRRSRRRAR